MVRITSGSIIGLLAICFTLGAAEPAQARHIPRLRIVPVQPIPNVNQRVIFISRFTGRASLYIPPSNQSQVAWFVRFGSPQVPRRQVNVFVSPYAGGSGAGYGGGGTASYPVPYYVPMPQPQPQPPATTAAEPAASPLPALGLPHDRGRLLWPLGLRIVPPALQTQPLLQQTEAQLVQVASQAAQGEVDPDLVQQTLASVEQLHRFLKEAETRLPRNSVIEAQQFLGFLEATLRGS